MTPEQWQYLLLQMSAQLAPLLPSAGKDLMAAKQVEVRSPALMVNSPAVLESICHLHSYRCLQDRSALCAADVSAVQGTCS